MNGGRVVLVQIPKISHPNTFDKDLDLSCFQLLISAPLCGSDGPATLILQIPSLGDSNGSRTCQQMKLAP
jgi:hypothetical protein